MRRFLDRFGFHLLFAVCLAAQLAPLFVSRYLPFHDAQGMAGLGGALIHRNDPAAHISDFYSFDIRAYPSTFYLMWIWLLAKLHISIAPATSAYCAFFIIGALPLSIWAAAVAFGRPRWLSFLAFPVCYHQQVWFGFLGSCAAIPGIFFALASARVLTVKPSWRPAVALAASALFVALCHALGFVMLLGLLAPLAIARVPWRDTRRMLQTLGLRLACLVPALIYLGPWLNNFTKDAPGVVVMPGSRWDHFKQNIRLAEGSLRDNIYLFWQWLGDGLRSDVDKWVAAATVACTLIYLVVGARVPLVEKDDPPPPGRAWLGWAALIFAAGYFLLPQHIHWPTDWWGARQRFILPLFLVGVVAARPWRYGLDGRWMAIPIAISLFYGMFLTRELHLHWRREVTAGLTSAIRSIPPGQSVLYLNPHTGGALTLPHPYLLQYYVAEKGGFVMSGMKGHQEAMWVRPKSFPVGNPTWGRTALFQWTAHSKAYDYFVVEGPIPPAFLKAGPTGLVDVVYRGGPWSVFKKNPPPPPPPPLSLLITW
jgi:hypothetical protein